MKKVCVNVSGLLVERCLLATMRYAAYLSSKKPRPCKGHFGKQASGAPFWLFFHLHLSSFGEGSWTLKAAIDESVPAPSSALHSSNVSAPTAKTASPTNFCQRFVTISAVTKKSNSFV